MRKAINENPVVQAALVGVLILGVGLMLVLRMGSSDDSGAGAEVVSATDAGVTTAADPAAAPPATGETAAPADPATPSAPAGQPTDFKAGPGLPKEVAAAYDAGDAVVLLVVNNNGIDDRRVKTMVEALEGHPEAAVFVTEVHDVADYSRITEGVNLNRTPALVVVRPKSLTDGPMPTAVVSYGFRGAASVEQALEDALYKGPDDLPYYPSK
jgi:hypothetical protein